MARPGRTVIRRKSWGHETHRGRLQIAAAVNPYRLDLSVRQERSLRKYGKCFVSDGVV